MRMFVTFSIGLALIASVVASPQLTFDGATSAESNTNEEEANLRNSDAIDGDTRTGLLAGALGRNPVTGEKKDPSGRLNQGDYCCCASARSVCPGSNGGGGGGGSFPGIKPRDGVKTKSSGDDPRSEVLLDYEDVGVRIVNDPIEDPNDNIQRCPQGLQRCCYRSRSARNQVRNQCRALDGGNDEVWRQGCTDRAVRGGTPRGLQCGERFPVQDSPRPLTQGQAKPYEFPWTCLVLNGKNDFLGSCAIIPDNLNNDISRGTDRVITAAHKLKSVGANDLIKVRIIEYDASGFNNPETESHREFTVTKFRNHPQYNDKRLTHDVALLFLEKRIRLRSSDNVNAACLPKCDNMFSEFQFRNGTGTRCWVAGWGKDRTDGNFQFIQRKVDVPIEPNRAKCDAALRSALQRQGTDTNRFRLDESELCAGGEVGKDACEGDGGTPLVCQADTGRWYVVGLVTWGVSCGEEKGLPGVYANVFNMLPFIMGNF